MDGASHLQVWWQVILPLVKAPLAIVSTFLFVGYGTTCSACSSTRKRRANTLRCSWQL
jgi:ABC-type maltose transport system permease subunit